ncbi:hypothetical protein JOB18_003450 [Solea senegalensis]|uniref:Secreted protein n=1 Tax=Solea senegalensis TaxID=28829 RepID=A0AAV6PVJ1_SOLSE|nr:hypothetical protein JOB18_003450 [Solea senegalensis]
MSSCGSACLRFLLYTVVFFLHISQGNWVVSEEAKPLCTRQTVFPQSVPEISSLFAYVLPPPYAIGLCDSSHQLPDQYCKQTPPLISSFPFSSSLLSPSSPRQTLPFPLCRLLCVCMCVCVCVCVHSAVKDWDTDNEKTSPQPAMLTLHSLLLGIHGKCSPCCL